MTTQEESISSNGQQLNSQPIDFSETNVDTFSKSQRIATNQSITEQVPDSTSHKSTSPATSQAKKRIRELARHIRYQLNEAASVTLTAESASGIPWSATLINCSITGALVQSDQPPDITLTQNQIIPNARLRVDNIDYPLGRVVIQRINSDNHNNGTTIALSTIDRRLPLDDCLGPLLKAAKNKPIDVLAMEYCHERFSFADFAGDDNISNDILARCENFSTFMRDVVTSKKFAYYRPRSSITGARIRTKPNAIGEEQTYLMFGSNDYLGLSAHPEVIQACTNATEQFGVGSTGTAPTTGTTVLHEQLCHIIATMHGREEALVFPSGYGANVGLVSGLAQPNDLLIADSLSHASLQDGMRLSGASITQFRHNDTRHLERLLKNKRAKHNGCLIITEGLFSMTGDLGNLKEIVSLAQDYEARVLVDQGHCFGLLGQSYTGTAEYLGVGDKIDISMGLFSKSVGTLGGFVTGSKALISWYRVYARSHMFATSFPPGIAAATIKSLEIIQRGELQQKLANNVRHFVSGMIGLGLSISPDHVSPIIPILIGDENKLGIVFEHLQKNGVFALPVVYPVVSRRRCQFRFSIRADLTTDDLDYALKILDEALDLAKLKQSSSEQQPSLLT